MRRRSSTKGKKITCMFNYQTNQTKPNFQKGIEYCEITGAIKSAVGRLDLCLTFPLWGAHFGRANHSPPHEEREERRKRERGATKSHCIWKLNLLACLKVGRNLSSFPLPCSSNPISGATDPLNSHCHNIHTYIHTVIKKNTLFSL